MSHPSPLSPAAPDPESSVPADHLPPSTSKLDRYKLETVFEGDDVVHIEYTSDLATGQRKVEVKRRWRWERDIGEGGFGVVWLEKEVGGKAELRAVKRVGHLFRGIDWSRELTALAKVKERPDLFVQIQGWYENKDFVFLAMEYIKDGDLSQYLEKFGQKARSEAKEIIRQLAEGLVVLHEQDICHRDLKPQNILIAAISPIWVKITDFGMAKREKNTSLRTNCGTSGYLAPEVLGFLPQKFKKGNQNSYTNSVDLWSLGVITHEVLTSEIPFLQKAPETVSLESGLDTGSQAPEVDMELFFGYCQGFRGFPISSLQNSKVSEEGIDFVVRLLVVDPSARMSAKNIFKSPWISGKGLSGAPDPATAKQTLTPSSTNKVEPYNELKYIFEEEDGRSAVREEELTTDQERLDAPSTGIVRRQSHGEALFKGLAGLARESNGELSEKAHGETLLKVVAGLVNVDDTEVVSKGPEEQTDIDALLKGLAGIAPGGWGRKLRRKYR